MNLTFSKYMQRSPRVKRIKGLGCLLALSLTVATANDDPVDIVPPTEPVLEAPVPNRHQQLRLHQRSIEKMLADVDRRYGETASQLHSLKIKIEQKRQQLDKIHFDIQQEETKIDREKNGLAQQIKAAYKMGRQEQLQLLLNQQDPALTGRMLLYYKHINDKRLNQIKDIENNIAQLEQLNQQDMEITTALESTLQEKQNEQSALNAAKQQRNDLLARIAKQTTPEQQLSFLQDSEAALQQLINNLPDANVINDNAVNTTGITDTESFSKLKGQLPWPVKGRLAQQFGNPRAETVWDGVVIEAPEGQDVQAIAPGKVTFAEWLKSYGYLLIIEHEKGYMSLYAFNQSLYKHKNDTVKAGDIIAAVGQSGGNSKPGLYFGIRKQGMAINPQQWCRK